MSQNRLGTAWGWVFIVVWGKWGLLLGDLGWVSYVLDVSGVVLGQSWEGVRGSWGVLGAEKREKREPLRTAPNRPEPPRRPREPVRIY